MHNLKHLRHEPARHAPKDTSTSNAYVLTNLRDHFSKEMYQKDLTKTIERGERVEYHKEEV